MAAEDRTEALARVLNARCMMCELGGYNVTEEKKEEEEERSGGIRPWDEDGRAGRRDGETRG